MKPTDYPANDSSFFAQYHRMREGPNYFLVCYKNTSVLRQDPKDAWRVLGPAKFTEYAQQFKQWCIEQDEKYGNHPVEEGRADTSFASEAQTEEEVSPTANTKMVT